MDNDVLDTPTPPDSWASLDAELDGLDLTTLLERLMARTGKTVPQMATSAEIEQPVLYKILNGENREFKAEHADRLLEGLATQGCLTDPAEAAVWRQWLHVAAYVHFEEYKAALPRLKRITDLQERLAALAEHLTQQYQALARTYERTGGQFPAGVALVDVVARQMHARYGWIRVPEGCELRDGNEDECTIVRSRVLDQPNDFGPDADATSIEPGRYRVRRNVEYVKRPLQTKRPDQQISSRATRQRQVRFLVPEMIRIPAGFFWMGTSVAEERILDRPRPISHWPDEFTESPAHRVYISSYALARYPVTKGDYRTFFVDAHGYEVQQWWSEPGWAWLANHDRDHLNGLSNLSERDLHKPMVVTWFEAEAYCTWLSEVSGKPYRLPREAEWEKAARGPNRTLWPWGNVWDKTRCHGNENGSSVPTPVNAFPQGAACWPDGKIEDLIGNTWEWCSDWFDPDWYRRPEASVKDCVGPVEGSKRVVRGVSFMHPVRRRPSATARWMSPPAYLACVVGFRVAHSL